MPNFPMGFLVFIGWSWVICAIITTLYGIAKMKFNTKAEATIAFFGFTILLVSAGFVFVLLI